MLYDEIKQFVTILLMHLPYVQVVGSYARKEKEINDLDLITMMPISNVLFDLQRMLSTEKTHKLFVYDIKNMGTQYAKVTITLSNLKSFDIDIWNAQTPYEMKFLKWMRTMDKGRNIAYRKMARDKNLILSDRYLYDNVMKEFIDFDNIEDLKKFLKQ